MKIDQLTYFSETARLQHVGKASKSLNISPSAITHSIKSLEAELGCKLFQRQGKNIYLTAHGKRLQKRALEIIALMNKAKDELNDTKVEWEGSYRVGITHVLSGGLFVPIWNKFQQNHRGLHTEIYNLRSSQVIEFAARGEIDFGLCFNPLSHPNVTMEVISEQPLLIALKRSHPLLKKRKSEQMSDLPRYSCASPKAFQGIEICENHPELKKFGIRPSIDFVFDSYEAAIARVQGTDSWALLPEIIVEKHGLSTIIPQGWNAKAVISAVWPKDRLLPKSLEILKDFIKRSLA